MFHHGSDLIAATPFLTGTFSGLLLAIIGFNWTLTAIAAVTISVITMVVVFVVLRRRQQAETVITVNRFILK